MTPYVVLWSHGTNGMGWIVGIEVYLQQDPLGHSHAVLWSHGTNGMGWTVGIEVYLKWDTLGYSHALPWYIPMGNNVQWTSVCNTGHPSQNLEEHTVAVILMERVWGFFARRIIIITSSTVAVDNKRAVSSQIIWTQPYDNSCNHP